MFNNITLGNLTVWPDGVNTIYPDYQTSSERVTWIRTVKSVITLGFHADFAVLIFKLHYCNVIVMVTIISFYEIWIISVWNIS